MNISALAQIHVLKTGCTQTDKDRENKKQEATAPKQVAPEQIDKDGENEKQDVTVPKQVVPKPVYEGENEKQEEKPIDVTVPKQVVECTCLPHFVCKLSYTHSSMVVMCRLYIKRQLSAMCMPTFEVSYQARHGVQLQELL